MSLLVYTRPGYETIAAQELNQVIQDSGWPGYTKPWPELGFCELRAADGNAKAPGPTLRKPLIFARQWLNPAMRIESLPAEDRITPMMTILKEWLPDQEILGFYVEHPDTNEGRELARFCKKFAGAFHQALKKSGIDKINPALSPDERRRPWVHICFDSYETGFIGLRYHDQPAWASGIPRLKMPSDAPSRSTLKLEEAFLRLMSAEERAILLGESNQPRAVDLGAAPGGWTYHLLQHGFAVTAIDNGSMQEDLLQNDRAEHLRLDAFHYRPSNTVTLMVCDMVEQPTKVTALVEKWVKEGWCQTVIFNLKLPMKKKWAEVTAALQRLECLQPKILRASHLYHDRDEVTLLLSMRSFVAAPAKVARPRKSQKATPR